MNRHLTVHSRRIGGAGSFVCCLVLFGLIARASFQEPESGSYTFRSEVRLVLLDVSVQARDGGAVSGLSKENFSVLENGRPQQITVFDHNDRPVTVGILVDESRSMTSKRVEVLTAAQTFVEESNRDDQIFVLNFNDKVTPGLPGGVLFSDSLPELRSALYRGFPEGKTALRDAVIAGLRQLELGQRDKKTLVVISDGGDNASEHTRRQMLDMVEGSIATIYTIGLFDVDDPDRDPGRSSAARTNQRRRSVLPGQRVRYGSGVPQHREGNPDALHGRLYSAAAEGRQFAPSHSSERVRARPP